MANVVDDEFHVLMERLRAGCPDAARDTVRRYGDHVLRVVRSRLHRNLRSRYDSIDFTQDVWGCFFKGPWKKYHFEAPEELIGFLAGLAYRRVADVHRKGFGRRKTNRDRVRSLDREYTDRDSPVRGPTPSQFAIANECWEGMLKDQPDNIRLLLEMLRQGHEPKEIAERTGLHPKRIQRCLLKIAQNRGKP